MAPTGNFVFCYGAFAMGDFYLEEINNIGRLGITKRGCFCELRQVILSVTGIEMYSSLRNAYCSELGFPIRKETQRVTLTRVPYHAKCLCIATLE